MGKDLEPAKIRGKTGLSVREEVELRLLERILMNPNVIRQMVVNRDRYPRNEIRYREYNLDVALEAVQTLVDKWLGE